MKDIDLNKLKELAMPFSARDWFVNKDEEVVATDHEVGPDDSGEIFVACANAIETARFISAANPATIMALIERLEALQRERDELRVEAEKYAELSGRNAARAQKAEAELARRDGAAGEPVGVICENPDDIGLMADFDVMPPCGTRLYAAAQPAAGKPVGYIDPDSLREFRGRKAGGSWSPEPKTGEYNQTLPIYLTAQPAVLPPEITPTQAEALTFRNPFDFSNGANWMREQYLALGCQPEKVVMLPQHKTGSDVAYGGAGAFKMGKSSGYNEAITICEKALNAAGVKWEALP